LRHRQRKNGRRAEKRGKIEPPRKRPSLGWRQNRKQELLGLTKEDRRCSELAKGNSRPAEGIRKTSENRSPTPFAKEWQFRREFREQKSPTFCGGRRKEERKKMSGHAIRCRRAIGKPEDDEGCERCSAWGESSSEIDGELHRSPWGVRKGAPPLLGRN